MFNLKHTYPIGIGIGEHNIYATQLKQTRQNMAIREMIPRELDGEADNDRSADDALVSVFKEISKNKRFSGK